MKLLGLLVLLVLVVALLPVLTALKITSGFQNVVSDQASSSLQDSPPVTIEQLDPTRDYLCTSLRGSNIPCPEGTFCDGVRQVCEKRCATNGSIDNIIGFYS